MAQNNDAAARLLAACQLGRDFVGPMNNAIAKLNTGGLSVAQVQEVDADDGEEILVRGIGDNPVRELILTKGIVPTYPLEYFAANNYSSAGGTTTRKRNTGRTDRSRHAHPWRLPGSSCHESDI